MPTGVYLGRPEVRPVVSGSNGPVTIRAMLELDAAGKKFQKVVVQNINLAGGN